jgi:hypothetical protein
MDLAKLQTTVLKSRNLLHVPEANLDKFIRPVFIRGLFYCGLSNRHQNDNLLTGGLRILRL